MGPWLRFVWLERPNDLTLSNPWNFQNLITLPPVDMDLAGPVKMKLIQTRRRRTAPCQLEWLRFVFFIFSRGRRAGPTSIPSTRSSQETWDPNWKPGEWSPDGCGSKNQRKSKINPAKWKHGPKPAVCPSDGLILSQTQVVVPQIVPFAVDKCYAKLAPGIWEQDTTT